VMYPLKEPIEEISYFGSDLLPTTLRMLLTTAFTLAAMSGLSPALTLTVVPPIRVFLVTRQYFRKKLATEADTAQNDCLSWSNFLEEHLSSVISIQLLGQEKRQERRAFRLLARPLRSHQRLYRTATWFTAWCSLAIVLAMPAVIGYGGKSVLAGTLSIGSLVAFYGFVTQLFDPLSGASDLYARAQKTFASIRQVQGAFALLGDRGEVRRGGRGESPRPQGTKRAGLDTECLPRCSDGAAAQGERDKTFHRLVSSRRTLFQYPIKSNCLAILSLGHSLVCGSIRAN